jgi:hypothetical protein
MIRDLLRAVLLLTVLLSILSVDGGSQPNLAELKSEYESVTAQLQKHVTQDGWWIDSAPESPGLLARQWTLAGQWVAAWLNAHPNAGSEGVGEALREIGEADPERSYLKLGKGAFLVVAPSPFGNVFIVAKVNGQYRLAWSTAQPQEASGGQAKILADWRPESVWEGARGTHGAPSHSAWTVLPGLGMLPTEAQGHARFYIDGGCIQCNGATMPAEISLWLWDGKTARPQIVHLYGVVIGAAVGTRLEGDLLKVREKTEFRTFNNYGPYEARQTDWIARLTPEGVEDLGETSLNPELDAVDELFYRVIHHQQAGDVAAPAVVKYAEEIVRQARKGKYWKELRLGNMMEEWTVHDNANGKILCLDLQAAGTNLFTLKSAGGKLFISDMTPTDKPCVK